jgi:cholesterol transport system auxiliary component
MSARLDPRALLLSALAALLVSGCALTSKSDPLTPRYFTPERALEPLAASTSAPAAPLVELRLGRVSSTSYLDERIVYRDSEHESGYYTERRWTEAPEQYLRRRLARVLFEQREVRQVVGGPSMTLEVELTAFDDVRAPKHVARAQVTVMLHDQHLVVWEETLRVDEPIVAAPTADAAEASVEALGRAMRALVDRVADRVMRELATASARPGVATRTDSKAPPALGRP